MRKLDVGGRLAKPHKCAGLALIARQPLRVTAVKTPGQPFGAYAVFTTELWLILPFCGNPDKAVTCHNCSIAHCWHDM